MPSLRHLITFISVHDTVNFLNFCDSLECIYLKYKSCDSTACELPD